MFAPHTVTLYSLVTAPEGGEKSYNITVLRGVFLEPVKGTGVNQNGLISEDMAVLRIPFGVNAFDGITLTEKRFIGEKEYAAASDRNELWTLRSSSDFFVIGELVEEAGFETINQDRDGVYRITSVATYDFGAPALRHWKVGGR